MYFVLGLLVFDFSWKMGNQANHLQSIIKLGVLKMTKRKVHDGIVGLVVTGGAALGYWVDTCWLAVPGVLGLVLIQSALTGFCPVYFLLDKTSLKD
jgi:hypothetical protein